MIRSEKVDLAQTNSCGLCPFPLMSLSPVTVMADASHTAASAHFYFLLPAGEARASSMGSQKAFVFVVNKVLSVTAVVQLSHHLLAQNLHQKLRREEKGILKSTPQLDK